MGDICRVKFNFKPITTAASRETSTHFKHVRPTLLQREWPLSITADRIKSFSKVTLYVSSRGSLSLRYKMCRFFVPLGRYVLNRYILAARVCRVTRLKGSGLLRWLPNNPNS